MSVKERIRRCLLIEKMYKLQEYSERLGLEDVSTLNGKNVNNQYRRGERRC